MHESNIWDDTEVLNVTITTTQCQKRHEVCHNMAVTCTSKSVLRYRTQLVVPFGFYALSLLWPPCSFLSQTVSPNTAMHLLEFVPCAAPMTIIFRCFLLSIQIIAVTRQFSSPSLPVHWLGKLQTNSVTRSPCWEAEGFSSSRNCLSFMVHYHVHKGPTLCSVLN